MEGDPVRAAVIGARRRRQGLGAWLAGFLAEAGAEVVAVAGSTPETSARAADALAGTLPARPTPYADVERLLARERPDLVVVASPDTTHAAFLRRCLAHETHVLCEKPVCWGGPDPAGEARALGEAFLAARRHLVVNTQLPFALPTWRALFPRVDPGAATRFTMEASPSVRGFAMLPAALPHPLALLLAVTAPGPSRIEHPRIERSRDDGGPVRLTFALAHPGGRIEAEVTLRTVVAQPRPLAFGFDGHLARREIEQPGYRMRLVAAGRAVPLPDPMRLLVRSVLERLRAGPPEALDPSVHPGMEHLGALCAAWDDAAPARTGAPPP